MKKQLMTVEINVKHQIAGGVKGRDYVSVDTEFNVYTYKGRLFKTVDSIQRKLEKLYPPEVELPVPNETKVFGPSGDGSDDTHSNSK